MNGARVKYLRNLSDKETDLIISRWLRLLYSQGGWGSYPLESIERALAEAYEVRYAEQ